MPSLIDYLLSKTRADETLKALLSRPVPKPMQSSAKALGIIQQLSKPHLQNISPTSMRSQVVPMARKSIGQVSPQLAEDVGYGLRGALSLTPFRGIKDQYEPQDQRQKMAQRIGTAGYGMALTAPLGGPNYLANILSRGAQGTALGVGLGTAGNLLTGKPVTKQTLKQSALSGVETSWQLAFTNAITDKIAAPIFPKLTSGAVGEPFRQLAKQSLKGATGEIKRKFLIEGAKRLFGRALLETPTEAGFFTAVNKLSGEEKRGFIEASISDLPGTLLGNMIYAGASTVAGGSYNWNKKQVNQFLESAKKAYETAKSQPGGLEAGFIGEKPKIDLIDSIKGDTYVIEGVGVPEGSRRQGLATEEVIGKLKTAQQKGLKFVEVPAQTPKGRKFFASLVKKGILDDLGKIGTSGHKYGIKPISEQFAGVKALDISPKSTVTGEIGVDEKYAFNINKPKLGLTGDAAKNLDKAVEQIRPALEGAKGEPLTNKEIIKEAQKGFMLQHVMGRQQAAEFSARLQTSREFLKKASQEPGVSQEYLNQAKAVSSAAADAGRSLRAFTIEAGDKEWFIDSSAKEKIIKDLLSIEVSMKEIIEASEGVDWSNAKQVAEFYRKFKPATLGEKLTEFRYVNMLSSPNTHQVNAFSNFLQTGIVAPIEKVISGQIDWVQSKLTGSERKYYASQGIDYTKGYWKALPEGWQAFKKHLKGEGPLTRPDIKFLPTGTSKAWRAFTTPLRALEAGDQFFRAMAKSGELESLKRVGVVGEKAQKLAADSAEYRLFRSAFDPSGKMGQNKVLQSWDKWNSAISHLRRAPGGKWIVPFLQTPTNILKQGFEYSPLGVTTVKGAGNPTEQLSKTIIGTSVYAGALAMANAGLSTWDAPTNAKEKEAFYAAGLQPYSLKFGDKWISYSRLGPLSYPIAMAAATKWSEENNADDSVMQNIGKGVAGSLRFFADQSYVRGIGDAIDAARGDEFKLQRMKTNIPSQLIPYRAFQGWLARIVDPVYRKAGSSIESLLTQVPGASKTVPPYTDPEGKPSMRQYPLMSALSPYKVTKESPKGKEFYDTFKEAQQLGKEAKTRTEGEKLIAESIWDQIKTLQPEEQRKKLAELEKQGTLNEKVFNRLKTLRKGQQRDWSPAEKKVYNLGPTEEAKFHWRRIENMPLKKQKEYLTALEKKGLLTKQTMDELVKLREKEEDKLLKQFER